MDELIYVDRVTGRNEIEKVYGAAALRFLYGSTLTSRIFGKPLVYLLAKFPFFSAAYGALQRRASSRKKVLPFIENFGMDPSEFYDEPASYSSFDDFFTRKLKKDARPIAAGKERAIMPADARYLFYPDISKADGFIVKGEKFCLKELLGDEKLASEYESGTMVMARLCPTDYHRFHFPVDCIPGETRFINGWLYSVNPIALKQNVHIFTQNKRSICALDSKEFGKVLFIEIGATNVGSIHQTYQPGRFYSKGEEKGYFSFGASSLILLFPPRSIKLDSDLIRTDHREIRCLMGQSLGSVPA